MKKVDGKGIEWYKMLSRVIDFPVSQEQIIHEQNTRFIDNLSTLP